MSQPCLEVELKTRGFDSLTSAQGLLDRNTEKREQGCTHQSICMRRYGVYQPSIYAEHYMQKYVRYTTHEPTQSAMEHAV